MFPLYREVLKERYAGVRVIPYGEFPHSTIAGAPAHQREVSMKIATLVREKGCDGLITGNGG